MDRKDYITASEIGEYIFCKRGWWLRIHGLLPTTFAMQDGTAKHESLLFRLTRLHFFERVALFLIISGLLILIFLMLCTVFIL